MFYPIFLQDLQNLKSHLNRAGIELPQLFVKVDRGWFGLGRSFLCHKIDYRHKVEPQFLLMGDCDIFEYPELTSTFDSLLVDYAKFDRAIDPLVYF
ncbi:hypothetical protein EVA_12418 [gut metagenome]|uniref:Uncharacterized protein n=1 Tax=gut metagenome TaxID=749906 RepID=J9CHC2_9ZZZZ